jgi:hypothetical protein
MRTINFRSLLTIKGTPPFCTDSHGGHLISFLYNYLQYELHQARVGNNMGHMIIT